MGLAVKPRHQAAVGGLLLRGSSGRTSTLIDRHRMTGVCVWLLLLPRLRHRPVNRLSSGRLECLVHRCVQSRPVHRRIEHEGRAVAEDRDHTPLVRTRPRRPRRRPPTDRDADHPTGNVSRGQPAQRYRVGPHRPARPGAWRIQPARWINHVLRVRYDLVTVTGDRHACIQRQVVPAATRAAPNHDQPSAATTRAGHAVSRHRSRHSSQRRWPIPIRCPTPSRRRVVH